MIDKIAIEKVKLKYIEEYNDVAINVEKVSEETFKDLLNTCDNKKHMEKCIYLYDEENPDKNIWIDVEGEGYGWLWLNERDDESKWHGLLRDSLLDFIEEKGSSLNDKNETVVVVHTGDKIIYHFIERESSMCDTIFTFSNTELDF